MSRPANVCLLDLASNFLAESSAYVPGSRKLRVTGWSLDDLSEAYFPYKILCHPQLLVPGGCLFLREPQTGGLLVFLRSHPKTAGEKNQRMPETRTQVTCGVAVKSAGEKGWQAAQARPWVKPRKPIDISRLVGDLSAWAKFVECVRI